ncbi:MAG: glycogen synthase GlgA [Rhodospirillales bacterium]
MPSEALRILFVTSEAFPLVKTGGLADVSGALPLALRRLGADVRVLMPGYAGTANALVGARVEAELGDVAGLGETRIVSGRMPDTGIPVLLVDCPARFFRDGGPYQDAEGRDYPDNAERFALLSHVAAAIAGPAAPLGWTPDVIHANDWHAGLLPALLPAARDARPATVFTIHNMAFQGVFPAAVFPALGVPDAAFTPDGLEYYGQVSFLKAGLRWSDRLTTVSPTYAREILTPEFGFGMEGLLRARAADLTGILNGIDDVVWDPSTDIVLPANYDHRDLAGKIACKKSVQAEFGLAQEAGTPLVAFISRLTDQKMADILPQAIPALAERGAQIAVLGAGDPAIEAQLRTVAAQYPRVVAVRIGYSEPLAHRLYAGADILLAPARFEPCGLAQLYAMRYGTLPVVRPVGGLADTVTDATEATLAAGTATGFVFDAPTADGLVGAAARALELYQLPIAWRRVQLRAMAEDFGWSRSAEAYLALYRSLTSPGQDGEGAETPDATPSAADRAATA